MYCQVICTVIVCAAMLAASPAGYGITLQPDETASKDSFGYEFLATTNLNNPPFGALLPAGGTTTGHDSKSVIEFDLSSVSLTGSQVQSASLDLFVVDATTSGFGVNPTPGSPLTVNLSPLTGSWDEATVDWSTIPTQGAVETSQVISGHNLPVSFDVTNLVKLWLDGGLTNNGMILEADSPVGSSPNWVTAAFSSASGTGAAPALVITPVPEPSAVLLALLGGAGAMWMLRGRCRRRRLADG